MKISTRGRYALEALVDLALNSSQGPVSLKSITERCGLSEAYVLQIFLILRRAGIVDSVRGAQGGYILSKKTSDISAGQVLEAVEGPLAPVSCIVKGCKERCGRYEFCATRSLWGKITGSLSKMAGSITLEDLVKACNDIRKNKSDFFDYSI